MNLLLRILWDERGTTLAITRKVASTVATATAQNVNADEIEAVVNGGIDDSNIAADGVKAVNLNPDVALADNGLAIGTGGALKVDPSDTTPCLEVTDGGIRAKVDNSSIERASGGLQIKAAGVTLAMLATALKDAMWPVGSIYSNATVATNPGTLLGFGTWVAVEGVVVVGYKSGDSNFGTPGATVGAATVTLTAAQSGLPAHSHGVVARNVDGATSSIYGTTGGGSTTVTQSSNDNTAAAASEAHSNIQPSLVCYCWRRTA